MTEATETSLYFPCLRIPLSCFSFLCLIFPSVFLPPREIVPEKETRGAKKQGAASPGAATVGDSLRTPIRVPSYSLAYHCLMVIAVGGHVYSLSAHSAVTLASGDMLGTCL